MSGFPVRGDQVLAGVLLKSHAPENCRRSIPKSQPKINESRSGGRVAFLTGLGYITRRTDDSVEGTRLPLLLFYEDTMAQPSYDLLVIGGGPGGYTAAIRASQLGMKTALIERDRLGGVCLNWGCIPTKALLKSAEILQSLKKAGEHGITFDNLSVDFGKIIQRSRGISDRVAKGVEFLMKKNSIDWKRGTGRLAGGREGGVHRRGEGPGDRRREAYRRGDGRQAAQHPRHGDRPGTGHHQHRGDDPRTPSGIADHDRRRGDRHRVRLLLQCPRHQGHGGGDAPVDPSGGGSRS